MIGPEVAYKWVAWLGVPLLLTAVFKFCPAYPQFGVSTAAKNDDA